MADGTSRMRGLARGDDVHRTARPRSRTSGLPCAPIAPARSSSRAPVSTRSREPASVLDCANSGTTMRMLAGLLAGRPFHSVLTGDASLSARPMAPGRRAAPPDGRHDRRARRRSAAHHCRSAAARSYGVRAELAVASGQVKTALVLAGSPGRRDDRDRRAGAEPRPHGADAPSRSARRSSGSTTGRSGSRRGAVAPFELDVPGDPSSAAFFVVAATITPGSDVVLEDVSLNPGRIAFLDVLREMGARHRGASRRRAAGRAGRRHRGASPRRCTAPSSTATRRSSTRSRRWSSRPRSPTATTEIRDAAELRVKESDRIATLEQELTAARRRGRDRARRPDACTAARRGRRRSRATATTGSRWRPRSPPTRSPGESTVRGLGAVASSYPGFADDLASLAGSRGRR